MGLRRAGKHQIIHYVAALAVFEAPMLYAMSRTFVLLP